MTNRLTTPPKARTVIVGVDTHTHVHVAVAIDSWGDPSGRSRGSSRTRVATRLWSRGPRHTGGLRRSGSKAPGATALAWHGPSTEPGIMSWK